MELLVLNNTFVSAHHTILVLAKWNNEQILAIKKADKFTDDGCLIETPPGMGKTKLFATFVIFYF